MCFTYYLPSLSTKVILILKCSEKEVRGSRWTRVDVRTPDKVMVVESVTLTI